MLIKRLSILGVGLIGGSLARALRRVGECAEVIGCGRNTYNLQKAVELGVIDRYYTDPAQAVAGADVVVAAVPLGTMAPLFAEIREALGPETVVTDVGSAKGSVVMAAREQLGTHIGRFVPGHPIAGTEKSGVTASFADLFVQRRVILTPLIETETQALEKVTALWELTGAEVVNMSVEHHDEILAATSHLPHVLAYCLVDTLAQLKDHPEIFRFAAGGFRDFTRIASSDPRMWHDICLANRPAILKMIEIFQQHLTELAHVIEQQDGLRIEATFARAKAARDKFTA